VVTASIATVRVPRWYAGFFEEARVPVDDFRSERVGPFAVVDPENDLERATFGRPDQPGVVLFEGYLFERQSLTRELGLDACASNAQISAAAFQRWGDDVFDRLDGSYILAVWDPHRGRLLVGHDALGHHPVYYAATRGAVWFGSNVLALAESGRVSNRPNRVSLALAALMKWPAVGQTFFEDIFRLPPGRYLFAGRDLSLRQHAYFSPWPQEGEPDLTEAEVRQQFEPALVGAVERCMSQTPTGIMLSGGLDSVTIAALASEYGARHGLPRITAVSGRLDKEYSGEEPMQTATAAALDMPHFIARESQWTEGRDDVAMSLDVIPELPAPSRIYWVGGYMAFYRHAAAQKISVLLTGSGGDNWVSVGNAYAAQTMRRLELGKLTRFVRSYVDTGGLSLTHASRALLWSGGVRVLLDAIAARRTPTLKSAYHRWRSRQALPEWCCPDPALRLAVAETMLAQRPPSLTEAGRAPANYLRHEQRSVLNPYYQYEFEIGFHIESACGLRLLSPYHDRRLVQFLNRVPPELLLQGGAYKGLLRAVAERRLPGLGLQNQRKIYSPGVIADNVKTLRAGMARVWPTERLQKLEALGVADPAATSIRFEMSADRSFDDLITMSAVLSAERWAGAHCSQ
jgi:asparagine synthase (glutamine-hydrolysing)